MHGIQKGDTWTRLAQIANPGDTQITLESAVEWMVGDEIIIAPTGYKPEEVERFTIAAVSVDTMTITLDSPLQYKHIGNGASMLELASITKTGFNTYTFLYVSPDGLVPVYFN